MKIKNISCTQFAGVCDRNVSFTDGINVIYGKNESGKSTLVNLISRTLFQNAKLDRRKDKGFFELYFPGAKKGSDITGDFADGKVHFKFFAAVFSLLFHSSYGNNIQHYYKYQTEDTHYKVEEAFALGVICKVSIEKEESENS